MSTIDMLGDRVAHGAKVALADEAGEAVLDVARAMLEESWPEVFSTPAGRAFAKLVAASALHYAAERIPGAIPSPANVRAACGYVVEAQARDLIQPRLAKLRPTLGKLADIGEAMGET